MNQNKLLYIVVIILAICLLFTCNKGCIDDIEVPKIDTVITTKSDTFWQRDTIIKFKYKTVNKPYAVTVDLNPLDSMACDSIRGYRQSYEDSNLTVFTTDSVKGRLLGQSISYSLKVPIKIVDSVFVNITKTETQKKRLQLYVGVQAQVWPIEPHLGPTLSLKDKKNRMYHYQYDMLYNAHSIGYSINIGNPFKKRP